MLPVASLRSAFEPSSTLSGHPHEEIFMPHSFLRSNKHRVLIAGLIAVDLRVGGFAEAVGYPVQGIRQDFIQ